jgi:hypothetical protein
MERSAGLHCPSRLDAGLHTFVLSRINPARRSWRGDDRESTDKNVHVPGSIAKPFFDVLKATQESTPRFTDGANCSTSMRSVDTAVHKGFPSNRKR